MLEWTDEQNNDKFKVKTVEIESNGVWVENCDFRIDLEECYTV